MTRRSRFQRKLKEFSDPHLGRRMVRAVAQKAESGGRPLRFMEVCGTHTMAFSRSGLRDLLSGRIDLVSGPGCPVCVTDTADIDAAITLADLEDTVLCTYGDMMRVPGSRTSLAEKQAQGAQIRVVYSAADAVQAAASEPSRRVVFLAVGFETTAPGIALAVRRAAEKDLDNFYVYSVQKVLPPALRALLSDPEVKLDGLMLPGHVATIVGREALDFVAGEFDMPAVVAGFEPVDMLHGLDVLVDMALAGEAAVENAYPRAVRERGNRAARGVMRQYFAPQAALWRGLGKIPESGLTLQEDYHLWDASALLPADEAVQGGDPPPGCSCGEVLRGKMLPPECPLFASGCRPEDPVGPCMVSSEGACAAYYRYHREEY